MKIWYLMQHDRSAHCVWKLIIFYMINLYFMFETRLLIDTDFEEEIFFSMSDKFLLTKKYFETEKIWKSSTNWLKLILRRKPFFTFSDQFLLTKGNKKLQSDNNLAPYDKFSHWLWKLAIFFMINLYLMFENCTLSWNLFSERNQFWPWVIRFCWH